MVNLDRRVVQGHLVPIPADDKRQSSNCHQPNSESRTYQETAGPDFRPGLYSVRGVVFLIHDIGDQPWIRVQSNIFEVPTENELDHCKQPHAVQENLTKLAVDRRLLLFVLEVAGHPRGGYVWYSLVRQNVP